MIRNNLSILMSERGIKNSTLSLKTGISKNTISSTAQNDGKMIQLETINKICQVLNVTPTDFFSYLPFDINIKVSTNSIKIEQTTNSVYEFDGLYVKEIDLDVLLTVEKAGNKIHEFLIETENFERGNLYTGNIFFINMKPNMTEHDELGLFWENVPVSFKSDISQVIISLLEDEVRLQIGNEIEHNMLSDGSGMFALTSQLTVRPVLPVLNIPL